MPPTDEFVVSMSGDAPVTLIVSATAATRRLKSIAWTCPTFTSTSRLLTVVKPDSVAVTS